MELQNGEYVFYRNNGVCKMLDVESQCMDGKTSILYYKLKPISDGRSTFYVPVSVSDEKLRYLLTREEVTGLIDSMNELESDSSKWSCNRRELREMYAKVLKSDDYREISRLISALYFKKRAMEIQGRRFSTMDEIAMRNAERLMLEEFGFVLEMTEAELRKYIDDRITIRQKE